MKHFELGKITILVDGKQPLSTNLSYSCFNKIRKSGKSRLYGKIKALRSKEIIKISSYNFKKNAFSHKQGSGKNGKPVRESQGI